MVIFSDGQDTQVTVGETPVSQILAAAIATKIPVFLIRTSRGKLLGEIVPDSIWKPAVESTGGRFYAAANEADVLRAIQDIDKRSPGTIQVKHYSTNQPRFAAFRARRRRVVGRGAAAAAHGSIPQDVSLTGGWGRGARALGWDWRLGAVGLSGIGTRGRARRLACRRGSIGPRPPAPSPGRNGVKQMRALRATSCPPPS